MGGFFVGIEDRPHVWAVVLTAVGRTRDKWCSFFVLRLSGEGLLVVNHVVQSQRELRAIEARDFFKVHEGLFVSPCMNEVARRFMKSEKDYSSKEERERLQ